MQARFAGTLQSYHVAIYAQMVLAHQVVSYSWAQQHVPGSVLQQDVLLPDEDGSRNMVVPVGDLDGVMQDMVVHVIDVVELCSKHGFGCQHTSQTHNTSYVLRMLQQHTSAVQPNHELTTY